MRRVSVVASGFVLVFSLYSLGMLLYDLSMKNFSMIMDNVLLRSHSLYHMIVAPMRSIGTIIALIIFLPFLRLFLINPQIAMAIFVVIQIAALLVFHITLIAISIAYINRAVKNSDLG